MADTMTLAELLSQLDNGQPSQTTPSDQEQRHPDIDMALRLSQVLAGNPDPQPPTWGLKPALAPYLPKQPEWLNTVQQYVGKAMTNPDLQPAWLAASFLTGRGPMRTTRLFHATNSEGKAAIDASGVIRAPAYFTPRRDMAGNYGDHVYAVDVPTDQLKVDLDLPGGKLLSVPEANDYAKAGGMDTHGWTIDDWIRRGHSVGMDEPFPLR